MTPRWWTRVLRRIAAGLPELERADLIVDAVFRDVAIPLAFKDADGVYRRANAAMARRFGFEEPATLVGRTDSELPTPADANASGVNVTSTVLRDRSGSVVGQLVACVDGRPLESAERRAAALEEERNLLREIINRVPDQIYAKSDEHRFLVANVAVARKIVGAPDPERIIGRSDHDFFPKRDADRYRADEAELMASGRDIVDLEESATYQGKLRWNLSTKVVLRDRERKVIGLVGINRDITARKEADLALAEERKLLHALMDTIPDPIYFKDRDGRVLRANRATAELLGATGADRVSGHRFSEFLPGAASREAELDERRLLETGEALVGSVEELKRADGASRWLLSTKVPIRDDDGQVSGLVGISKDVTERRNAEDALERGLSAFLEFANRAAEGDLTRRAAEGQDTLGRIGVAVNRMLDGFSLILTDLKRTAAHVSVAAQEILLASKHISDDAGRQYDEIHTTSSSVDQMAASMARVSDSAGTSAETARNALTHVESGDESVRETSAAMSRISTAVESTAAKMRLLADRVAEISKIIELIDEVASQSTLLSLNAAIQAAHAGEAGRGFGVVADEIRKLAERSIGATKEVGRIIETIQDETTEAMNAMENGTHEVRQGVGLAEQARAALGQISRSVRETVRLSGLISEASTEQATVTRHLAQTMETIASITQSTSSGAHETTQTITALVGLARQLDDAVARFRVRGEDAAAGRGQRRPRSG